MPSQNYHNYTSPANMLQMFLQTHDFACPVVLVVSIRSSQDALDLQDILEHHARPQLGRLLTQTTWWNPSAANYDQFYVYAICKKQAMCPFMSASKHGCGEKCFSETGVGLLLLKLTCDLPTKQCMPHYVYKYVSSLLRRPPYCLQATPTSNTRARHAINRWCLVQLSIRHSPMQPTNHAPCICAALGLSSLK